MDFADVRYWHLADIELCSANVRFWGVKRPSLFALPMSAYDPKRTLQRGSLSEGNVAAPSAWQQITVCSNCPS